MNTWTPIFSKIVDSSLWAQPDFVVKVFLTLLALKDADQVVRVTAYALGRKCWPMDKKSEARAMEALKILASPDRSRIEPQPFDGRRIKKVDDGWLILNGQFYEDMMRSVNRKAYKARKQAEYRSRKKGPIKGEAGWLDAMERGDVELADRIAAREA